MSAPVAAPPPVAQVVDGPPAVVALLTPGASSGECTLEGVAVLRWRFLPSMTNLPSDPVFLEEVRLRCSGEGSDKVRALLMYDTLSSARFETPPALSGLPTAAVRPLVWHNWVLEKAGTQQTSQGPASPTDRVT